MLISLLQLGNNFICTAEETYIHMIVHCHNKERYLGDQLVCDHSIIIMMIDVSAHEVDL